MRLAMRDRFGIGKRRLLCDLVGTPEAMRELMPKIVLVFQCREDCDNRRRETEPS